MSDLDGVSIDTTDGERRASSTGEKLALGLGAAVLGGGLLIAITNLVGGMLAGETAASSTGPAAPTEPAASGPTPTAIPTPTPPPLRDMTVVAADLPDAPPEAVRVASGWLVAAADLILREAPSDASAELGRLAAGDVVIAFDAGEAARGPWIQVVPSAAGDTIGWVRLRDDGGTTLAIFHPSDSAPRSGGVGPISAGPDGYLAVVWPSSRAGEEVQLGLAWSVDGERWQHAVGTQLAWGTEVAAGPTGWLAAAPAPSAEGTVIWLWESTSGRTWRVVGHLPPSEQTVSSLVGSAMGYLMLLDDASLWFSPDGIGWRETDDPFGRDASRRGTFGHPYSITVTDHGFIATEVVGGLAASRVGAAFSPDGRRWSRIELAGWDGGGLFPLPAGDNLLLLGQDVPGQVRAWRGRLAAGATPALRRDPASEARLESVVLVNTASGATGAYAIGWDVQRDTASLWAFDGTEIRPRDLPPDGTLSIATIRHMADGPAGLVLLGGRPTAAGENPVVWHLRADGDWIAEPEPIVRAVADPTREQCGSPPATAVAFAVLDPASAVTCFHGQPMTFVAFSATCEWCGEGSSVSTVEPAWMVDETRSLLLSPVPAPRGNWRQAVLHPDLDWQAAWSGAWVRITGHFADPAAESCRWSISSLQAAAMALTGREVLDYCRQRFVITAVATVNDP